MRKHIIVSLLMATGFLLSTVSITEASTKVMWRKMGLRSGQIGKVTILTDTAIWKVKGGVLSEDRKLKKGQVYRVYRYVDVEDGLYSVGDGDFVFSGVVKYETPSKAKLALLKKKTQR
ncbi:hypothetical protein LIS82_24850 [Cytobacillus solani]|uniref:hypothetical protein n=1 Tax=Cytobacillus solani TaxID=1637975 RepID=UPI0006AB800D|nr:hypothetical protein [Cytobacillus solani]USK54730.1 hypothetical protein LIS82_24850 [Cytobacillus solani]